jgi:hypothetical protein
VPHNLCCSDQVDFLSVDDLEVLVFESAIRFHLAVEKTKPRRAVIVRCRLREAVQGRLGGKTAGPLDYILCLVDVLQSNFLDTQNNYAWMCAS